MKTEEGNKLIAEFMGAKCEKELAGVYYFEGKAMDMYRFKELPTTHGNKILDPQLIIGVLQMKYHSSWDWLMPVVEKIENLGFDVRIIRSGSETEYTMCDITDAANNEISCISHPVKIDSVYSAVVEFIEWYNKQQHP